MATSPSSETTTLAINAKNKQPQPKQIQTKIIQTNSINTLFSQPPYGSFVLNGIHHKQTNTKELQALKLLTATTVHSTQHTVTNSDIPSQFTNIIKKQHPCQYVARVYLIMFQQGFTTHQFDKLMKLILLFNDQNFVNDNDKKQ